MPEFAPKNSRIVHGIAAFGIGSLAIVWLVARARPWPLLHLRLLDVAIMVSAGAMIGSASWIACEAPTHTIAPFTIMLLLLFARVFIVPGSAMRTLALSTLSMGLVSTANITAGARTPELLGMPVSAWATGGIVLAALCIALATIGTRVIFGLRREIREARLYGQYTLERKLGEGGMGVVFKAKHALMRRPTAIKLLPPEKASAEDVARFEREVQLTSALTHPNTIAIFDYGRSADGVFYYVMEYLDGVDLETLVEREGPLPPARAVPILVQMCEALAEAHACGVIHRDIKPANVLLCRRGQAPDFVKVVDFGLVKELARDAKVTAPGAIAGTPAYLAPEAVTHPDDIGPASDLYAVGAVAYWLLTGKLVFEGNSVIAILSAHMSTPPEPPSKRLGRELPAELESLVLACLQKKPELRPASARALADALGKLALAGWTKDDAEAWWTRFESQREPAARERGRDEDTAIADTIAVIPRAS
ncbi:MAG TPA: serine/threonine-protein kinase, partial [Labilithrix sp.]